MRKFLRLLYFNTLRPLIQRIPLIGSWFTPSKGYFPTLAAWLKTHPSVPTDGSTPTNGDWVLPVHPAETFHVQRPILAIPPTETHFDGVPADTHELPPTFVAHFHWGGIASHACEVLTPDGYLIFDLLYAHPDTFNKQEKLIFTPKMPIRSRIERRTGVYATLFSHFTNGVTGFAMG